jgi:hypothetical protein
MGERHASQKESPVHMSARVLLNRVNYYQQSAPDPSELCNRGHHFGPKYY